MNVILLIAALFLASLNLRPSISSVAPLLETIRGELGMSGFAASLLTTLPVLCMGLFAPSAVRWVARWGTERSLVIALSLIGGATLLRYFTVLPILLLATSFLAGVGIAVAGPLLSGFIKKYFAERASAVIGFYSTALVVGAALSAGLSVPFQEAFGGSWRASLAAWGWLAAAALPLWLIIARRAEKTAADGQPAAAAGRQHLPLHSPRAWLLTCFFGVVALIFYSITAWLAPAVEAMGYGRAAGGAALTLFSVIQMPVSLVLPLLIGRFGNRLLWLLLLAALELTGLLMLAFSGNPWIISVLLGIGAGGLFPVVLLLPIEETKHADDASAWSAMTQSGGYVIGSLGPLFIGMVHDITRSFVQPMLGLAVLVAVMMLLVLKIGNKKKQPEPAAQQGTPKLQSAKP
ncbi:CynX/NimT family MFS transporter [Paenibacillus hamazuiensis]|uniref:MFS transporter n=1 Tax=Paenibacillus hamazuiensis TaxID=2936508 RepID=UPI00200F4165|nr:MFS transporter [Paenibacillus hamazuiensis]